MGDGSARVSANFPRACLGGILRIWLEYLAGWDFEDNSGHSGWVVRTSSRRVVKQRVAEAGKDHSGHGPSPRPGRP
jgi:hypothetical protein